MFPIYAMAFSTYAYSLAGVEAVLLGRPRAYAIALVAVAALAGLQAYLRRLNLQSPPGLRYEEEDPDLVFQGFHLSEGLAAGSRRPE
jgi:hypothetical protein